jgi:hypothetical protein
VDCHPKTKIYKRRKVVANRLRDENIEDSFVSDLVGLPTRKKSAPKARTNIDPTSFGAGKDVGFFSTSKQKEVAGEGIKDTGAALAKEFRGLRPKPKKAATGLSAVSEEAPTEGGGFVSFEGSGKKNLPQAVANFGLPTDRLPSIEELGGALGGIAKFVSSLTKRNRARGLSPGTAIKKQVDKGAVGLQKTKLDALSKLREGDILAGDKDKAAERAAQIEALIAGDGANAFDESEDIDAILGS